MDGGGHRRRMTNPCGKSAPASPPSVFPSIAARTRPTISCRCRISPTTAISPGRPSRHPRQFLRFRPHRPDGFAARRRRRAATISAARSGMPDSRRPSEIGPQDRPHPVALRQPGAFRQAAVAGARRLHRRGLALGHRLGLPSQAEHGYHRHPGLAGWNLGLLAGPLFGDNASTPTTTRWRRNTRPPPARPTRPASRLCRHAISGVPVRALPKYWVGAFALHDNLSGGLRKQPAGPPEGLRRGGIAISWILGESSTRVKVDD